jgi:membrane protein YqaA with SNARE-associated domain
LEQGLVDWGLPALFALSFLAATVLPVGSEWLLAVLLLKGGDPVPAVAVASIGNFLGACTTYYIGGKGRVWLEARGRFPQPRFYEKAEQLFVHYGKWALLLTWLPILGDVLCLVAGIFGVGFMQFAAFTLTGKAARYAVVAFLVL